MTGTQPGERIVVIDDDYAMRLSCRQILARMGHAVETFDDGARGLAGVARLEPALVVVDLKMPGPSGLEVIRRLHELDPSVVVVITGYATIDTAIEAMKAGAYDFLPKPFSPDQLRMTVAARLAAGEAVIEVRDTGPGVAPEALPFLFDEFYRGRAAASGKVRGSGLGLAICRRIAAELGGAIEVESALGCGSTFWVRLPAGVETLRPSAAAAPALEPVAAAP
jgi:ActR/RegA family two-component response regulator